MTKTATLPTIDSAIRFLEAEIEAIELRRARMAAALDGLQMMMIAEAGEQPILRRSKPATGTAALILIAIKGGAQDVPAIGKDVKVKTAAIRRAIAELIEEKRIRVIENSWPKRYELVKR